MPTTRSSKRNAAGGSAGGSSGSAGATGTAAPTAASTAAASTTAPQPGLLLVGLPPALLSAVVELLPQSDLPALLSVSKEVGKAFIEALGRGDFPALTELHLRGCRIDLEYDDLTNAFVSLAESSRPSRLVELSLHAYEDTSVDKLTPVFEAEALPYLRSLVVTGLEHTGTRGELWNTWKALGPKIKLERLVVPSACTNPSRFRDGVLEDPDFCPFLCENWVKGKRPSYARKLFQVRMRERELRAAKASVVDAMARLEARNAALEAQVAELEGKLRGLKGIGRPG